MLDFWKEGLEVRKRIPALLLALVLVLSLAVPVSAAGPESALAGYESSQLLTLGDLADIGDALGFASSELDEFTGEDTDVLTMQEAAAYLLRYAGMEPSQLGEYPRDYNAMADSIGLADGITWSAEGACTAGAFAVMLDNVAVLYDALHADTLEPLFIDGLAQPIFPYTSGIPTEDEPYSNETSDIIRFFVYVETNYDTDGDGKLDLVKTLVQLPRAAMEGDYEAATIFEARPYITGCTDRSLEYVEGELDYDIYSQPAARVPAGSTTTEAHAANADANEWYYWNDYEDMYDYEDLTWYDYYLVRGFAVVCTGGLGTLGSEGFETCGSDLEIDAFKCVIEWLSGDRVAYTDPDSNITIDADWSNGNVGMTGRSYAGTTQFGLATTGVEGLKTIVPVAGIASWYEYTNSQGISLRSDTAYTNTLAAYCAGRYLDPDDYATIAESYGIYLYQLQQEQRELNGDYGDTWAIRDYTLDWANISCPALIVHGLNDDNVRTKMFDLMYDAYQKAGVDVKLLLHQGTHLTPTYPSNETEMYIGDELYDEILNRWFSHYLYDVDNGAENMAAVTVQDNTDGSWYTFDDWDSAETMLLSTSTTSTEDTTTITADIAVDGVTRSNWEDIYSASSTGSSSMYVVELEDDTTIKGTVEVHVRASTDTADSDALMMSAMLVDIYEDGFMAYVPSGSYLPETVLAEDGAWMGGGLSNFDLVEFAQTETTYKIIARGWIDLYNPTAGYDSASAATRTEIEAGKYYDYTIYLQPNVYTVEAGHKLALVIYTYEPSMRSSDYTADYSITIDNTATYASIPVTSVPDSTDLIFTDVSVADWFYESVMYVVNNGIMNGVDYGVFAPADSTTRAMLVTMLYRMEGEPEVTGENIFTDVADGTWYTDAVIWASENGIVDGVADDLFAPTASITREQIATLLYRYAEYKGYDLVEGADITGWADYSAIGDWALEAMSWANAAGLINGRSDTELAPTGTAIRCEVAAILMRFDQGVVPAETVAEAA